MWSSAASAQPKTTATPAHRRPVTASRSCLFIESSVGKQLRPVGVRSRPGVQIPDRPGRTESTPVLTAPTRLANPSAMVTSLREEEGGCSHHAPESKSLSENSAEETPY